MARDYGPAIVPPSFEESRLKSRARYNKKRAVWTKTGGYCWHCGAELVFSIFGSFQMDHLVPKSLGGSNGLENLVPACEHCNASKCNRDGWTVEQRGPKRPSKFQRHMTKVLRLRGLI